MKRFVMAVLIGFLMVTGCAGGTPDSYVDSVMGLVEEDPEEGYDAAVDELKQQRYQEGTQRLQQMASGPQF